MAKTTDENYITETIFVPLYNRSSEFRKLISSKFKIDDFGSFIRFTGNERKNNKYGNPDCKTNLGNFIEIKTKCSTGLQPNEKNEGESGNGYKHFLDNNPDKYLLYVVPSDYDLSEAVEKGRGKHTNHIFWKEVLDYLSKNNKNDPFIPLLCNKVEETEFKEFKTFHSYKVKVYETLIKLMELNSDIHIRLDDSSGINQLPDNMAENDFDIINFEYKGQSQDYFCIFFKANDISFHLPKDKKINNMDKYDVKKVQEEDEEGNIQEVLKISIISQNDFWKKSSDSIAKTINNKFKKFKKSYAF